MSKRTLKVYYRLERRAQGFVLLPEIRISGKWLLKQGFSPGDTIELHLSYGVIKVLNKKDG